MHKWLGIAAILLLCSAGMAFAQTGSVVGIVVDADNNPVEGARVSLWLDGACEMHVFTDVDGAFTFLDVPVGVYDLRCGKPRVGQASIEDVAVVEGEVTDVGVLALEGSGPHDPNGPKFQYQNQFQHKTGQQQ